METRIYSLQNTEIALRTQIAFATSEYAIEAWARGEAHLAKPDDQVIIPLSTSNSLDTKFEPFNQGEKKMQNWQIWWQLFFGG